MAKVLDLPCRAVPSATWMFQRIRTTWTLWMQQYAHNIAPEQCAFSEVPEASHKASLLCWHQRERAIPQPRTARQCRGKNRGQGKAEAAWHRINTVSISAEVPVLTEQQVNSTSLVQKGAWWDYNRNILIKQQEKALEPTVCLFLSPPLQAKKQFTQHGSKLTSNSSLRLKKIKRKLLTQVEALSSVISE